MAVLLVYDKSHWMELLPPEELTEKLKNDNFKRKYDSRFRKGDVIQVYEDDEIKEPCVNPAFAFVKVSDMTKEEALYLEEADEDNSDPENPILVSRRKYQVDLVNLPKDSKTALTDTKETTITQAILLPQLKDKSALEAIEL